MYRYIINAIMYNHYITMMRIIAICQDRLGTTTVKPKKGFRNRTWEQTWAHLRKRLRLSQRAAAGAGAAVAQRRPGLLLRSPPLGEHAGVEVDPLLVPCRIRFFVLDFSCGCPEPVL